jgi:ATP-dependent DNA ligase
LLEELELESERVRLVATFEDGEALFAAVCERGLEGVVAKRSRDPYRPRERQWLKTTSATAGGAGRATGDVTGRGTYDNLHSLRTKQGGGL